MPVKRRRLHACILGASFALVLLLLLLEAQPLRWPRPESHAATAAPVCIATADPPLLPFSRGTAEALWNLAYELDRHGVAVHVIVMGDSHEACARTLENVMVAARGVMASCAFTGGAPGSFLYTPRSSLLKHLRQRALGCTVIISHEWWTPLQDLLTERFFALGDGKVPHAALVNVHGGARWSRSWSRAATLRYVDVVEDADERAGAFLADGVVFPSEYMREYHAQHWALPSAQLVVPNIVRDLDAREPQSDRGVDFASLAYVGSVEKRKGIDAMLSVLGTLPHEPRIQLHIFGSLGLVDSTPAGEYIAAALAEMPHVNGTVYGALPSVRLWALLKRLKALVVMPTLLENQPMTIINAYQHGVPVVSYDVGGVAGMLTPDSCKEVVIPPDEKHLRARLMELFAAQRAYVPELASPMFTAVPRWLALVRQHLARKRSEGRSLARLSTAPSFAPLELSDGTTTNHVRALASALPTEFVLLTRSTTFPYEDGGSEDTLHALAEQLQRPGAGASRVAGVVTLVRLHNASLFPQPSCACPPGRCAARCASRRDYQTPVPALAFVPRISVS